MYLKGVLVNNFDYNRAILASDLTANEKITAIAIAIHYNWKTKAMAYPSIKTLIKETGLSKASIHRAKIVLVSQGYLVSQRRYNNSNLYLPQIPACLTQRLGGSHREELKDNIKDNLKDNKKDSNESFDIDITYLNQGKMSLDTIWKVFEEDERNDAAEHPVIRNRQDKAWDRGRNSNTGRNNYRDAGSPGPDKVLDQAR
jgi:DNA-binding transcriptional MocR family regulator